jgi:serine protease Do
MKSIAARSAGWLVLLLLAAAPRGGAAQDRWRELPRWMVDAFREVIREPMQSTVQVFCDGYRGALGAIVRSDGYIVTKDSELKGKIECQLATESKKREARIVARDSATDLAIIKIDAKDLPTVPWSQSDPPGVGSWLATPLLFQGPVSIGVVSVAVRKLPPNAAMGIRLDSTDNLARIAAVVQGLAADKAGLRDGDIFRKLDNETITSTSQLQQLIRSHYPGDKVTVVVERDGRALTTEVTLGSLADLLPRDERSEFQNKLGGDLSERRTGFPLAIQHDSVLRPNECGGPIVDLDGKVVGLNIARAGRVESYALPASVVRQAVDRLLQTELTSATSGDKQATRSTGQER